MPELNEVRWSERASELLARLASASTLRDGLWAAGELLVLPTVVERWEPVYDWVPCGPRWNGHVYFEPMYRWPALGPDSPLRGLKTAPRPIVSVDVLAEYKPELLAGEGEYVKFSLVDAID